MRHEHSVAALLVSRAPPGWKTDDRKAKVVNLT